MSNVKYIQMRNLANFCKDNSSLSIVKRKKPKNANFFFKKLLLEPFNITQIISKNTALKVIKDILDNEVSIKLKTNAFYMTWIEDMVKVCSLYCNTLNTNKISFSLESSRSCKRFHIDNVPTRLLVTYYGKGTEWFPDYACDYDAYYEGKKNEYIIKNYNERRFINTWDIAVFKGQQSKKGKNAILHRTPNAALEKPSLLMRLDHASFFH